MARRQYKRTSKKVGLAGAAVLTVAWAVPGNGVAATDEMESGEAPASAVPDTYVGSPPTYPQRMAIDKGIAEVRNAVGDRIGQPYVDEPSRSVTIPIVDLTESDRRLVGALSAEGVSFVATPALLSDKEEDAARDALIAALNERLSNDQWVMMIGAEGIRVSPTKPDPAIEDAIAGAIAQVREGTGADALIKRRAAEASWPVPYESLFSLTQIGSEQVDSRDFFPVRAGKWIQATLQCTVGYNMTANGSGAHRITTAGHCGDGSAQLNGGDAIGSSLVSWPNGVDVRAYAAPSGASLSAFITTRSNGDGKPVVTVRGSAYQNEGEQYCWTGWGIKWSSANSDPADERCGTYNEQAVVGGNTLHCVERRTFGGDSGGPVYALGEGADAIAVGTSIQSLDVDPPGPAHHYWNCYANIDSLTTALNYVVMLDK